MKPANTVKFLGLAAIVCLVGAGFAFAQEHPEHPKEHQAEHPKEHPSSDEHSVVTKEELALAIEAYVQNDATLKGGYFLVYDVEANKTLALTLDKVHKTRLSRIADDVYFACADFKTPQGKIYDLDIFMQGPNKEHLAVNQVTVHKEDGKERYTWYEEGGKWKMKSLAAEGKKSEHPEHPK
jgi:hypothetical protein